MLSPQSHHVDIYKGDQFASDYIKLSPKVVVPTLVHDGNVIVESTVINEYLDEVFSDVPLRPKDPQSRATMRVWTKAVDEVLHPACAEVTFSSCLRHRVKRLPPKEYEKFLASTPSQSVTPQWRERRRELVALGFDAPLLGAQYRLYDSYLDMME
jgi:glutathione S-transferase